MSQDGHVALKMGSKFLAARSRSLGGAYRTGAIRRRTQPEFDTMSKRRPSIDRGHSSNPPAGLSEGIEGDRKYDDNADNDLLDVGGDVHQHEAVEQNSDEGGGDHRAEDRADAAE